MKSTMSAWLMKNLAVVALVFLAMASMSYSVTTHVETDKITVDHLDAKENVSGNQTWQHQVYPSCSSTGYALTCLGDIATTTYFNIDGYNWMASFNAYNNALYNASQVNTTDLNVSDTATVGTIKAKYIDGGTWTTSQNASGKDLTGGGTYQADNISDGTMQCVGGDCTNIGTIEANTVSDGTASLIGGVLTDTDLSGSIMANAEDTVGYWAFDENIGTIAYDSSGKSNTGVIQGNPTWVSGKFGSALNYDGNDYIDIGNDTSITAQVYERSFIFWVNAGELGTSRREVYGHGWYSRFYIDTDYKFKNVLKIGGVEYVYVLNSPLLNEINNWYHIAVTFNGSASSSNWKFYIDGNKESSTTRTGYINSNAVSGTIGKSDGGNWYGIIDEFKIYNRTITDEEVRQDYLSGLIVHSPNGHLMPKTGGNFTDIVYIDAPICTMKSTGAAGVCMCTNSTDDSFMTTNITKCYE